MKNKTYTHTFTDIKIPDFLWEKFVTYQYSRNKSQYIKVCIISLLAYIFFTVPVYFYLPVIQPVDFISRLIIMIVCVLLTNKFYFKTKNSEYLDIIISLFIITSCLIWISLVYNLHNHDHAYRLSLAACSLSVFSAFISTRYIYAIISSFSVIITSFTLLPNLSHTNTYVHLDLFFIVLPTALLSLYMSWNNLQLSKYHFLQQFQSDREKQHLSKRNKSLMSQAFTDQLTQIGNRRLFELECQSLFRKCKTNPEYKLALFMLDLDFFKSYNDNYGHVQGDECLVKISTILDEICDYYHAKVYRFGGEEFVVSYEYGNKYDVINLARTLLMVISDKKIEHKFRGDIKEHVSISIGVSNTEDCDFSSVTEMIEHADIKLYQAKKEGKDTFVI